QAGLGNRCRGALDALLPHLNGAEPGRHETVDFHNATPAIDLPSLKQRQRLETTILFKSTQQAEIQQAPNFGSGGLRQTRHPAQARFGQALVESREVFLQPRSGWVDNIGYPAGQLQAITLDGLCGEECMMGAAQTYTDHQNHWQAQQASQI